MTSSEGMVLAGLLKRVAREILPYYIPATLSPTGRTAEEYGDSQLEFAGLAERLVRTDESSTPITILAIHEHVHAQILHSTPDGNLLRAAMILATISTHAENRRAAEALRDGLLASARSAHEAFATYLGIKRGEPCVRSAWIDELLHLRGTASTSTRGSASGSCPTLSDLVLSSSLRKCTTHPRQAANGGFAVTISTRLE